MISSYSDAVGTLLAIQRALDARLESDWMGSRTAAMGGYPPINIFQQRDNFVAIIEMPGIDKKDLEIEAKENTIRAFGKKTVNYDATTSVHRRERVDGIFDRTLSVPIQINPDGIKAEYRNGVLALFMPRAESDKPRSIKIR
jgi:HSP20 family protein